MVAPTPSPASLALARLRGAVSIGCWIVGLALVVQLVIWSLASFTDLRFEEVVTDTGETPLIVELEARENTRNRSNGLPLPLINDNAKDSAEGDDRASAAEDPAGVLSSHDRRFAATFNLAGGIGRSVMLIVVVLVAVGLMLGVATSAPGIEMGVSALSAALLLAILVLPLGSLLGLPWQDGALSSYEHMTAHADKVAALPDPQIASTTETGSATSATGHDDHAAAKSEAGNMVLFLLRFGAFPIGCVLLLTVLGLRFAACIESAAIPRESMRLDPALEREASNITPTSLHGVRGGSPFSGTSSDQGPNKPNGKDHNGDNSSRSVRQPSAGDAPKRLI